MPAEAARIALDTFAEHGRRRLAVYARHWYADRSAGRLRAQGAAYDRCRAGDRRLLCSRFSTASASSSARRAIPTCWRAARACCRTALGDTASARRSQAYYLDVTPHVATKGYAVKRIADVLGIAWRGRRDRRRCRTTCRCSPSPVSPSPWATASRREGAGSFYHGRERGGRVRRCRGALRHPEPRSEPSSMKQPERSRCCSPTSMAPLSRTRRC